MEKRKSRRMVDLKRSKFQGVLNIVLFNWHFYLLASFLICVAIVLSYILPLYAWVFQSIAILVFLPSAVSLIVSYYVYDFSGFYSLNWIDDLKLKSGVVIANINAGFDETSALIVNKLKPESFYALDFYDPLIHTEVSIKRARKAGLVHPDTLSFTTDKIPLGLNSVDYIFLVFSLHEIRNEQERLIFMKSLKACLRVNGKIIIVEHLRDTPNFMAYTIGFFHFYSKKTWNRIFAKANIHVAHNDKINPFVHIFVLE